MSLVVTGAGSGIGIVLARHLAQGGAVVVVADLDDEAAQRVGDRISDSGGRSRSVHADVLSTEGVDAVLQCAEEQGGPHILVNNAGGWGGAGRQFPDATFDQWRRVLELNLVAPMALTQRCVPLMMRLGGVVVVNIASSAGSVMTGTGRRSMPRPRPD